MITLEWDQEASRRAHTPRPRRTCQIDGCDGTHVARGYCHRHWQRWRRLGDPTAGHDQEKTVPPGVAARPCSDCGGPKPRGSGRKFCEPCAERRLAQWRAAEALRAREKALIQKYGITVEEYDRLLEAQGGGCGLCGGKPTKSFRCFDVDHNHETGEVRGLLCRRCNTGLGYIESGFHVGALEYLGRGGFRR